MTAIIFASLADRAAASMSAQRLARQGWRAIVALDRAEDHGILCPHEIATAFPRRGTLNGTDCMAGIYQTMLAHSAGPGDVLAKLDADAWLSHRGSEWLAGAGTRAHGFALGASCRWLGPAWAARHDKITAALDYIRSIQPCGNCGESHLSHRAFVRTCGIAQAPPSATQVWRSGRAIRPDAMIVTLPSRLTPADRSKEIVELFATDS